MDTARVSVERILQQLYGKQLKKRYMDSGSLCPTSFIITPKITAIKEGEGLKGELINSWEGLTGRWECFRGSWEGFRGNSRGIKKDWKGLQRT